MTAVVLALLVGFTIGHLLHLEYWTAKFFLKLVKVLHLGGDDIDMDFYVTAVALFCCSGFGWYSTLTEGITGDPSLLMSKAVLDGFTALIFASSLGKSMAAGFRVAKIKSLPLVDLMPALILVMPCSWLWSTLMG